MVLIKKKVLFFTLGSSIWGKKGDFIIFLYSCIIVCVSMNELAEY